MDKNKKAIAITVFFIFSILFIYSQLDPSLQTEVDILDKKYGEGAGFEKMNLSLKNNGDKKLEPEFYLIQPTGEGPLRLIAEETETVHPGEKTNFTVSPHEYTYITPEYQEEYKLIIQDKTSGRTDQKILTNQLKKERNRTRNTELVSLDGKPAGWKELFKGYSNEWDFRKSTAGVSIERTQSTGEHEIGYYLIQSINMKKHVRIDAKYSGLTRTSAGIRILPKDVSMTSQDAPIEVDITEIEGDSADISKVYTLQNYTNETQYKKLENQTVNIQVFYESKPGPENSFRLTSIEPTNRKT